MQSQRLHPLNDHQVPQDGAAVLYVMSRDVRVQDNHALLAAQAAATTLQLPLVVAFIAYATSGRRAREQFVFLYEGLKEVASALAEKNISFVIRKGETPQRAIESLSAEVHPAAIYFDFSPLRGPVKLHAHIAASQAVPVFEVDTHNVVPIWEASPKQEFAARTIRPKIHKRLNDFLVAPSTLQRHKYTLDAPLKGLSFDDVERTIILKQVANGTKVAAIPGEEAAHHALELFIAETLQDYATLRNDPVDDHLSGLSPYLHYGNLSSLRVALEVSAAASQNPALQTAADTLIEEMIVRKELSDNFCYHNAHYDSLEGAADWANRTLAKHEHDPREHMYSLEQLENAETADPAWNAAQHQLRATGKMHGYMRMYWAKKVLEWTESPQQAIEFLLYLNDFYHIDGGDPNGYVGILWSVAGLHDRPWGERVIFGQIRFMNYGGLKRKFAIAEYERRWNS